MRLSVSVLVAANVLVWCLLIPARTFAYATPGALSPSEYSTVCPPRPAEPAEGATATEADLVVIGQELADACYRREQLAAQAHLDSGAVVTRLGEPLTTAIAGEPTVKIGNWEAQPASSTVELSSAAKTSVRESDKEAVVFIAGCLVGLLFLALIYSAWVARR